MLSIVARVSIGTSLQPGRASCRKERTNAKRNPKGARPDPLVPAKADPAPNRDRGEPRGSAPPTPPYVRVRIRRFGGLSAPVRRDGGQAERIEGGVGQGDG